MAQKNTAEKTADKKSKEIKTKAEPKVIEIPAVDVRKLIKAAVDEVELKSGDVVCKVNMKCYAEAKLGTRIHLHTLRYQVVEHNSIPIKAEDWMKSGSEKEKIARKDFNFKPLKSGTIPWQQYYKKVLQFPVTFKAGTNIIAKYNGGGMAYVIPADFSGGKALQFV